MVLGTEFNLPSSVSNWIYLVDWICEIWLFFLENVLITGHQRNLFFSEKKVNVSNNESRYSFCQIVSFFYSYQRQTTSTKKNLKIIQIIQMKVSGIETTLEIDMQKGCVFMHLIVRKKNQMLDDFLSSCLTTRFDFNWIKMNFLFKFLFN